MEFKEKIKNESLPNGFVSLEEGSSIFYHYIKSSANHLLDTPKLLGTVVITNKLEVQVFVSSTPIPRSSYHHLLHSSTIKTTTELLNLLSFSKSTDGSANTNNTMIISILMHYLTTCTDSGPSLKNITLIKFVMEQLKLYQTPKLGRRYSVELLTTAFLWQLSSTALYKKLRGLLITPSVSRLWQISSSINVETEKLDEAYLKKRIGNLSSIEKKVVLIVDEVYTAQCIEYCNGQFVGLTKDGIPEKTVLTFIVRLIYGKYKDVVCLIPITKLDSGLLCDWFFRVMEGIIDCFDVLAISADCRQPCLHSTVYFVAYRA